jgi:hypothetical protein
MPSKPRAFAAPTVAVGEAVSVSSAAAVALTVAVAVEVGAEPVGLGDAGRAVTVAVGAGAVALAGGATVGVGTTGVAPGETVAVASTAVGVALAVGSPASDRAAPVGVTVGVVVGVTVGDAVGTTWVAVESTVGALTGAVGWGDGSVASAGVAVGKRIVRTNRSLRASCAVANASFRRQGRREEPQHKVDNDLGDAPLSRAAPKANANVRTSTIKQTIIEVSTDMLPSLSS